MILAALIAVTLLVAAAGLSGCSGSSAAGEEQPPASIEKAANGQPSTLHLSQKAVDRLGIQTTAVRTVNQGTGASVTTSTSAGPRLSIPYSAVLYDPEGQTWVFTNPQPLVFMRAPIMIEHIQGDIAILSSGPPVGTLVVTVGAQVLYGTELGVGHE
jgi:hypothetical protein